MAKAKEVTEAVDTSAEETIQEEVQHSDWFYKVKDYYDTKRWNLVMVKNAVKKDKITEEEYEENLRFIASIAAKRLESFTLIAPFLFETNKRDAFFAAVLRYAKICERVAADTGCDFINPQKDIDKALRSLNNTALSPDRVHPNAVAHMIVARSILKHWHYRF